MNPETNTNNEVWVIWFGYHRGGLIRLSQYDSNARCKNEIVKIVFKFYADSCIAANEIVDILHKAGKIHEWGDEVHNLNVKNGLM